MPRRRPPTPPPLPLTVAEVLTWTDAHRNRTGSWPNAFSGPIPQAPLGTNWRQVDNALRYGLTIAEILAWVDAHHERTDLPPRRAKNSRRNGRSAQFDENELAAPSRCA